MNNAMLIYVVLVCLLHKMIQKIVMICHAKRHTFQCRRHTYAKSILAEPPSASKEQVAKVRYKLQPNNSPVKE